MGLGFKEDIFSKSKIKWISQFNKNEYIHINYIVKTYISSSRYSVKQNRGMELNSNNFKLIFKNKKIILKKWNKSIKFSEIKNILNLMFWLNKKKLPIQKPNYFIKDKFLIKYKEHYWSFFDYVEGDHYRGDIKEFKDTAKYVGKFTNILNGYPRKKFHNAPQYFSNTDYQIIKLMNKKNFNLKKKFGKYSKIISIYLPDITRLFEKYKSFNKNSKKKIDHIDLHPHNIITRDKKVQVLLDIDSCKIIEEGHAIAFNALKICKQTVLHNKNKVNKKMIVQKFMNIVTKEYKINNFIKNNLYYFAISEVLRRLLYMFKLTLKKNDKKWNRIIPIQLGHLDECKEFFLNKNNKINKLVN